MAEHVSCTSCRHPWPVEGYAAVVYAPEGGEWLAQLCRACHGSPAHRRRFALDFWAGEYGAATLAWSRPRAAGASVTYFIYRERSDQRLLDLFIADQPLRRRSRLVPAHRQG